MKEENKDLDAIISRIKKLLKHAESAKKLGSLEEAETFATKANELLIEYNLKLHQVMEHEDEADKFKKWAYGEKISYKNNSAGNRWQLELIAVITKYNFCNYTWNTGSKTFRVYGNMDNVDTVVWIFNFLSIGLLRLAQEHHRNLSVYEKEQIRVYSYLKNFLMGAIVGIDRQLRRKRHEQSNEVTGLILYNDKALQEFVKIQEPKLKTVDRKQVTVGMGYSEGIKAGEGYNITSPLAEPKSKKIKQLK